MAEYDEIKNRIQNIKDKRNGILRNKETGEIIAKTPDKLPPLRKGFVRVVHQTRSDCMDGLIDNGLIYNRNYANKNDTRAGNYTDVGFMTYAFTEDSFWESLTKEGVCHRNSDIKAIFDMPIKEYEAHCQYLLGPHLNGTLSRGYLVGAIPNYGTENLRLTLPEMEKMKQKSLANPLSQKPYETPNWKEDLALAWENLRQANENTDDDLFGHYPPVNENNLSLNNKEPSEPSTKKEENINWDDEWDAWNDEDSSAQKEEQNLSALIPQIIQRKKINY